MCVRAFACVCVCVFVCVKESEKESEREDMKAGSEPAWIVSRNLRQGLVHLFDSIVC